MIELLSLINIGLYETLDAKFETQFENIANSVKKIFQVNPLVEACDPR